MQKPREGSHHQLLDTAWHRLCLAQNTSKAESSKEFIVLQNRAFFQMAQQKRHSNSRISKQKKDFQLTSLTAMDNLFTSEFLNLNTLGTWDQTIIFYRRLCIAGCLTAYQVSAHWIPVVHTQVTTTKKKKKSPDIPDISWGMKQPSGEKR